MSPAVQPSSRAGPHVAAATIKTRSPSALEVSRPKVASAPRAARRRIQPARPRLNWARIAGLVLMAASSLAVWALILRGVAALFR